ncbi:MAG TPA: siderophore biosynthesis protein [Methylophaga aminisulfidivorans]|uniref:IucA/IucC family protein n=1 Tax=Methylophaga TaxID=40222 RepID=UPI0017576C1E|nr:MULTISPECIES: IucA/IucC family protein [Methylophaga]HIC47182.1 siderophore biosynthesis protein [Methylophaga sp.]HIM40171.1 siderophore biosynthesis protein [Methylophaga aminisulfidivorans]
MLLADNKSTTAIHSAQAFNRVEAEFQNFTALLNCYLREFAIPVDEVVIAHGGNLPLALTSHMLPGEVVSISLPSEQSLLAIKADRWSLLGRGRFNSAPFLKQFGKPWRPITATEAITVLLREMAGKLGTVINNELLEQVENSIAVTYAFLSTSSAEHRDSYISSEQSLLWGHPLHPTPKSRAGVSIPELLACSPEVGSAFQLYWFRIDPSLLQLRGSTNALSMLDALVDDKHCYPCHPWEVSHIMNTRLYRIAHERGLITPIGLRGLNMSPTSSVRTLYHAEQPYFLKCSIHVRLTNCIRKNAWYELESAVYLNDYLADSLKRLEESYPRFCIMREPAATSLDFTGVASDTQDIEILHLQECFGLLFRENLTIDDKQQYDIELAGAVFAWDRFGESLLQPRIKKLASLRNLSYQNAAILWLTGYLEAITPGIFSAFFDEGIIFEPHLQNTLIGLNDGIPEKVWIRDLEGTKLTTEKWPVSELSGLSERARESVYYSREKGWNRIAYCLLINNLSEAIFHISNGSRELEQQCWDVAADVFKTWKHEPEIAALLTGQPIPSKNNLKTRLLQRADKQSDYTFIAHPMRTKYEES